MFEIVTYYVFRKLQHETMPKGETMMLPRPLQLLSDFSLSLVLLLLSYERMLVEEEMLP